MKRRLTSSLMSVAFLAILALGCASEEDDLFGGTGRRVMPPPTQAEETSEPTPIPDPTPTRTPSPDPTPEEEATPHPRDSMAYLESPGPVFSPPADPEDEDVREEDPDDSDGSWDPDNPWGD